MSHHRVYNCSKSGPQRVICCVSQYNTVNQGGITPEQMHKLGVKEKGAHKKNQITYLLSFLWFGDRIIREVLDFCRSEGVNIES